MAAKFDYLGSRATADRLIKKFGMRAVLRRGTTDRECFVVIVDYEPSDKQAMLANPTDRKVVMSAVGLESQPPDNEQDMLVTFVQPAGVVEHELLPFTCPVKPTAPAGVVAVYEFTVRR
jgi:hypothetical protein